MGFLEALSNQIFFISGLIILGACVLLTVQTRFVQVRAVPRMLRLLLSFMHPAKEGEATIRSHRALMTAMSTTLGISTMVAPAIAIKLGGPGALVGFLIVAFFGAAASFAEVTLALTYRKKLANGSIAGGPMQYLHDAIHPFAAKWYAAFAFLLLLGWSAAQSNQLCSIFHSPLLGKFAVPTYATGLALAALVTCILIGGIKRVASVSARLVPLMFVIYVGACLWIVGVNYAKLPEIVSLILHSCMKPRAFASGALVGGIVSAFRWGMMKGLQCSEAGLGTQTIPHSMAETDRADDQGILSMVSTYCAGLIAVLSGLVVLMTGAWLDESLSLGIHMLASSFQLYFSFVGIVVVILSTLLFGFGTILGNSYNGSECFTFLTNRRGMKLYYLATAALIFWGAVAKVQMVWTAVDFLLIPVAVPHILAVSYLALRKKEVFNKIKEEIPV